MKKQLISEAELDAKRDYIMAAAKDDAPVSCLCYRPAPSARRFARELELSGDGGVIGDIWGAGMKPGLQVSILPKRILDLVWTEGDKSVIHPGDTMIADMDMSEANLPTHSYLRVGSAVLQVSDIFNGGCEKWVARYGKPMFYWFNRKDNRPLRLRGILCQIISDGIVREGDAIKKMPTML